MLETRRQKRETARALAKEIMHGIGHGASTHPKELFLLGSGTFAEYAAVRYDHTSLAVIGALFWFWAFCTYTKGKPHWSRVRVWLARVAIFLLLAAVTFWVRMPEGATHLDILRAIREVPEMVVQKLQEREAQTSTRESHHPLPGQPKELLQENPKRAEVYVSPHGLHFLGFKESPYATEERKAEVRDAIEKFYAYLADAGFEPPKNIPPIGLNLGTGGGSGGLFGPGPATGYTQSLGIGVGSIQYGARQAYADWAFSQVFTLADPKIIPNMMLSRSLFANYFTDSYSGKVEKKLGDGSGWTKWSSVLWNIRQQCGKNFTDRSLFFFSKIMNEPTFKSGETADQDFDLWFRIRLDWGMMQEDGTGGEKLVRARQIYGKTVH